MGFSCALSISLNCDQKVSIYADPGVQKAVKGHNFEKGLNREWHKDYTYLTDLHRSFGKLKTIR
ncbi:MAG: hypothetical protein KDH84_27430, partial [Calditrichaeota bacterium]|nr:hypothetical protein [Calditrichota bacterium]